MRVGRRVNEQVRVHVSVRACECASVHVCESVRVCECACLSLPRIVTGMSEKTACSDFDHFV